MRVSNGVMRWPTQYSNSAMDNSTVRQTLGAAVCAMGTAAIALIYSCAATASVTGGDTALTAPHGPPHSSLVSGEDGWAQVPLASRFRDIQPSDWAYQALQDLRDRYGLFPDPSGGISGGTFAGDRPLTRYGFAAALAEVFSAIEQSAQRGQIITNDGDLRLIRRLAEEFAGGLAPLSDRMTDLETRTVDLERNQFSTTAKLYGGAIFDLSGRLDAAGTAAFQNRVQMDIVTSFQGRDSLRARLLTANAAPADATPPAGLSADIGMTGEGQLTSAARGNTDGDIVLDQLTYTAALGDDAEVVVSAVGGQHRHYVHSTVTTLFSDGYQGLGGLSAFAQASPIYQIGGGTGAGVNVAFADGRVALSAGYLAERASAPGGGVFNQDYAALGQLTLTPSDRFQVGLTYVRGYHTDDNAIFDAGIPGQLIVGTFPANALHGTLDTAAITNSYGMQLSYAINRRFTLNAFGGYTDLQLLGAGDGEIWYYGLGAGVRNVVLPQSLAGLLVGVEPYLGDVSGGADPNAIAFRNDTSLHVEAFYQLQLSEAISLTPGLIWITAPNQNRDNNDVILATFRTTLRF